MEINKFKKLYFASITFSALSIGIFPIAFGIIALVLGIVCLINYNNNVCSIFAIIASIIWGTVGFTLGAILSSQNCGIPNINYGMSWNHYPTICGNTYSLPTVFETSVIALLCAFIINFIISNIIIKNENYQAEQFTDSLRPNPKIFKQNMNTKLVKMIKFLLIICIALVVFIFLNKNHNNVLINKARISKNIENIDEQKSHYINMVIEQIKPYIIIPDGFTQSSTVIVEVTVLPDMHINELRLLKSSGNKNYDINVQQAIKNMAILPRLPDDANLNNYQKLKLIFRVN